MSFLAYSRNVLEVGKTLPPPGLERPIAILRPGLNASMIESMLLVSSVSGPISEININDSRLYVRSLFRNRDFINSILEKLRSADAVISYNVTPAEMISFQMIISEACGTFWT